MFLDTRATLAMTSYELLAAGTGTPPMWPVSFSAMSPSDRTPVTARCPVCCSPDGAAEALPAGVDIIKAVTWTCSKAHDNAGCGVSGGVVPDVDLALHEGTAFGGAWSWATAVEGNSADPEKPDVLADDSSTLCGASLWV